MDSVLIALVVLLVGGLAVAFYMDWLGLWVSEEEMREQINRSRESQRESGSGIGLPDPVHGKEATGAAAFGGMGGLPGSDRSDVPANGQAPLSAKEPTVV